MYGYKVDPLISINNGRVSFHKNNRNLNNVADGIQKLVNSNLTFFATVSGSIVVVDGKVKVQSTDQRMEEWLTVIAAGILHEYTLAMLGYEVIPVEDRMARSMPAKPNHLWN
jgi:hypothetical protein